MTGISNIFIYAEPRCRSIEYEDVAAYIQGKMPAAEVFLRGPLLEEFTGGGEAMTETRARALAAARVRHLEGPAPQARQPLSGEVEYELRRLRNRESSVFGILYDAGMMLEICRDLIPSTESGLADLSIIFTNQLIGSRDLADKRYHARTVILGAPSIVSTGGMVEAPARARGYYLARRSGEWLGLQEEEKNRMARSFADDFLELEDPRLTSVAKGLAMQAVVYRLTNEPFCTDKDCCLFNAHWQSELIRSQLGSGPEFCRVHSDLLADYQALGDRSWT
ncbi:MAG: hypothetical protein M1309_02080 [Actinobacteria bacterium]|nr:hypothetical protein [Actinomycetota bacterium]